MFHPSEVIEKLELKKDMKGAEFGSGSGKLTILLAKKLKEGKVYAIDILKEPLSALEKDAEQEGVYNIQTIRSDLEREKGSTLPPGSLDLVLVPNVLFQAEKKDAIIKEAKRVLKKGGKLAIIDWKEDVSFGPSIGRVGRDEVDKIAKEEGLELKRDFELGDYHFCLIFEK